MLGIQLQMCVGDWNSVSTFPCMIANLGDVTDRKLLGHAPTEPGVVYDIRYIDSLGSVCSVFGNNDNMAGALLDFYDNQESIPQRCSEGVLDGRCIFIIFPVERVSDRGKPLISGVSVLRDRGPRTLRKKRVVVGKADHRPRH